MLPVCRQDFFLSSKLNYDLKFYELNNYNNYLNIILFQKEKNNNILNDKFNKINCQKKYLLNENDKLINIIENLNQTLEIKNSIYNFKINYKTYILKNNINDLTTEKNILISDKNVLINYYKDIEEQNIYNLNKINKIINYYKNTNNKVKFIKNVLIKYNTIIPDYYEEKIVNNVYNELINNIIEQFNN